MDGPTNDAPDEDTKAELGFDLRPRYPFRFTPEHIAVDILTASLTPRSSSSTEGGVT